MEGLSFFDAVKALSEKAGIPLEIDDNANKKALQIDDCVDANAEMNLFEGRGIKDLSTRRESLDSISVSRHYLPHEFVLLVCTQVASHC